MSTVQILEGDCRELLKTLPDESVQTCITSPPYFQLRDYDVAGQIGLEVTVDAYVSELVAVFREVRRTLRKDGTLWLVMGDSYWGSGKGRNADGTRQDGGKQGTNRGTVEGRLFKTDGNARRGLAYDNDDIEGPSCQGHDCPSESLDDGRTDAALTCTTDSDSGPALSRVAVLCRETQAHMERLIDRLPIGDCSGQAPIERSLSAILDLGQIALRAAEPLRAFLESTPPESWRQRQVSSHLWDRISACLRSLHACAAYVQECVRMSDEPFDAFDDRAGSEELCAELARHIQGIAACCSQVLTWLNTPYIQPNCTTLKPKDLVGIPWRVAFALQADGWWLRSDVVWAKRAPMPESVTDRPTRSHEFLFLLAKSGTYFYDHEAIREPDAGMASGNGFAGRSDHRLSGGLAVGGTQERWTPGTGRTKRDVWLLGPEPYPGAHFAVMPTKLVEPCVLAGTSERGCCSACGAPWRRLFEATGFHGKREPAHQPGNSPTKMDSTGWQPATRATGEWEPTCVHSASTQPCTVLDPFAGSGTVGVVALKHNRNAILLELNSSYCNLIRQRIDGVQRRLPLEEVS